MNGGELLLSVGVLMLASIAVDALGRRTFLPRVSLLILLGIAAGPVVLDLLPDRLVEHSQIVTDMALAMVAFLLGGELSLPRLKRYGRAILTVSLGVVAASAVLVGGGLALLGISPVMALMLAGIATATDPAAAQDVIHQSGRRDRLSRTVLGVVAIDDGWGVILFGLLLGASSLLNGGDGTSAVLHALREVGGGLAVGVVVGLAAAALTGRLRPGEPSLSEGLGVVFVCGGAALWLDVSFLLAPMAAGVVVANLASHHRRAFREIEHVEWPFLVLFFVLAGARLDLTHLSKGGLMLVAYVALRIAGRVCGGWLGGRLGGLPDRQSATVGLALMPQAGVALGLALAAGDAFPQIADPLLTVTIASTVIFEVAGPILTRWVIMREGTGNHGKTATRRTQDQRGN